ncbi:hypothetical protein AQUCO_01400526v1 [Aquilegia coerulea]|uniref:Pentacotripeptide-repeat region of PRORP domain-containing protein n=1 Tax=Aquilegia coerulea TaxID=218851 RepID=A0A2G5DWV4_AQUCA|nr:hypothetical protein AQUCO_01400526v1 [Aquilegia coerulea]
MLSPFSLSSCCSSQGYFPLLVKPSHTVVEKEKANTSKNNYNSPAKSPLLELKKSSVLNQSKVLRGFDTYKHNSNFELSRSVLNEELIDPIVITSWLGACCKVREVRMIHSIVVKVGKLSEARKVFDEMSERNVVSWTAMLNGYLKNGSDDEVLRLFVELVENGVQPNSKTYVCVLNLCGRRLDFEFGKQIHACVVKGNWSNLILDSAIVYFYGQCGDLSGSFRAFDRMPERDVVSWTSMITACAQHGDGEEAISMFSKMQSEGFLPNEFTVCSVLKACGIEKNLKFGRQLHCAVVKKTFNNDVFVGTSLVSMYVKCEETTDARRVFNGMKKRNTVTWTSMIAGYAQNGLGSEAVSLFRMCMPERNLVSWKSMILGYARNGLCREALQLMYRMEAEGNKVDDYIRTTVFSACGDVEWESESLAEFYVQPS